LSERARWYRPSPSLSATQSSGTRASTTRYVCISSSHRKTGEASDSACASPYGSTHPHLCSPPEGACAGFFDFTCAGTAGLPAPARPPARAAPRAAGQSASSLKARALLAGADPEAKVFTLAASEFGLSTAGGVGSALSSRTMERRAAYSATLFAASSVEREIMEELLCWLRGAWHGGPECRRPCRSRRESMVAAGRAAVPCAIQRKPRKTFSAVSQNVADHCALKQATPA
jgi:hypothetical protein